MLDSLVRICEIRLTGFKNTTCGVVQMPSELNEAYFMRHADVLGIYGQNGSGKTAVIEAMDFIQRLLMGKHCLPMQWNILARIKGIALLKLPLP